jgi:plasmid replication initiation protein
VSSTVSQLATWALLGSSLKAYLGISGSGEDAQLQLWLAASAEMADQYLDGALFDSLPASVEQALYDVVRLHRSRQDNDGVARAKTNDLEVGYGVTGATVATQALRTLRMWLRPYKSHRELDVS